MTLKIRQGNLSVNLKDPSRSIFENTFAYRIISSSTGGKLDFGMHRKRMASCDNRQPGGKDATQRMGSLRYIVIEPLMDVDLGRILMNASRE